MLEYMRHITSNFSLPCSLLHPSDRFRGKSNTTVYIHYYFFNVTNVPDVRAGAKPVLVREWLGCF